MQQAVKRGKETLVTLDVKLVVVSGDKKLVKLPENLRKAMLTIFNH